MPTRVTILEEMPSAPLQIIAQDGSIDELWAWTSSAPVKLEADARFGRSGTVEEVLRDMGATPEWDAPVEHPDGTLASLPDGLVRDFADIFRYFFRYPDDVRFDVHAFCAAVSRSWALTVRDGSIPNEWTETQADGGEWLLEFGATLDQAGQYGQEEQVAAGNPDLEKVDFAKTMSPSVNWEGTELTDPRTGEKATFASGELHLTDDADLQDQIGTTVTEADLISHWNLSFS